LRLRVSGQPVAFPCVPEELASAKDALDVKGLEEAASARLHPRTQSRVFGAVDALEADAHAVDPSHHTRVRAAGVRGGGPSLGGSAAR